MTLRIAIDDDADTRAAWVARHEVAIENDLAAGNPDLDPLDPRWVLAVRAQTQLQGSCLTPERRRRVLQTARHLGITSFDANLIIALVQDRARRGLPLADAAATLALMPEPPHPTPLPYWLRFFAALGCGIVGTVFLIWWLVG